MSNKIIKLNRGDSYEFPIIISKKDNPSENYILLVIEILYVV